MDGLSDDRAFAIAYNAALQLCTIIVASEGYRTRGINHHRTTFNFIKMADIKVISDYAVYFNKCRQKRNDVDYDRASVVSEKEKAEIIKNIIEFESLVKDWIKDKL
ncbi:MAG: hypothetical protein JW822_08340 [Spirochaetales bacterium]|nr:hypothetical protein [Spirochaetales bacterium]